MSLDNFSALSYAAIVELWPIDRINQALQRKLDHLREAKKANDSVGGGTGSGPGKPSVPIILTELPPWAFDFNQANNPNLTNGFEQPPKPGGG